VAAERLTAEVRGQVQGVGFRWFVQRNGRNLGLTGYARNLADGRRVEVVAEGERSALEHLLNALRRGPEGAYVESVQHSFSEATGEFSGFETRH
jgi:acylphosphatase